MTAVPQSESKDSQPDAGSGRNPSSGQPSKRRLQAFATIVQDEPQSPTCPPEPSPEAGPDIRPIKQGQVKRLKEVSAAVPTKVVALKPKDEPAPALTEAQSRCKSDQEPKKEPEPEPRANRLEQSQTQAPGKAKLVKTHKQGQERGETREGRVRVGKKEDEDEDENEEEDEGQPSSTLQLVGVQVELTQKVQQSLMEHGAIKAFNTSRLHEGYRGTVDGG
jgi:hypothetical protein